MNIYVRSPCLVKLMVHLAQNRHYSSRAKDICPNTSEVFAPKYFPLSNLAVKKTEGAVNMRNNDAKKALKKQQSPLILLRSYFSIPGICLR